MGKRTPPDINRLSEEDKARIERMIGTWFQTSSSYRMVVRFPEGKTGMEALRESGGQRCDDERWLRNLGELQCGDQYLRCYASPEHKLELSIDEWAYYKQAGGGTYQATGPMCAVKDPHWAVELVPFTGAGTGIMAVRISVVQTKHPDQAVAALFSPAWKPADEYGKPNSEDGVFRYRHPNSKIELWVKEVKENDDQNLQNNDGKPQAALDPIRSSPSREWRT